METVDILLATFNGENYLRELMDSLANQSYSNIRIIVCDDCSNDKTLSILKELQRNFPVPIELHPNRNNIGIIRTFSKLMELSRARYVMFCDQDDIWKTDKVEKTLLAMQAAEEQEAVNKPVLVHTDLEVVNEAIKQINSSYWSFTRICPQKTTQLNRLMVQNVVTGCTVMMNRALVDACGPIPHGAIMHDWWVALVASALGKVVVLPETTIYYRQHASNCLGARKFFSFSSIRDSFKRQKSMNQKKRRQAQKFASVYHNVLSDDQLQLIENYTTISDKSLLKQIIWTIKYRYYRQGIARNLASFVIEVIPS